MTSLLLIWLRISWHISKSGNLSDPDKNVFAHWVVYYILFITFTEIIQVSIAWLCFCIMLTKFLWYSLYIDQTKDKCIRVICIFTYFWSRLCRKSTKNMANFCFKTLEVFDFPSHFVAKFSAENPSLVAP